jgi:UDP-N-acetylglucosamine acyltransferase
VNLHGTAREHTHVMSAPTSIHPTAILGEGVELGVGVKIGPHSVIAPGTRIGDHSDIGPQVVLDGVTTIGARNRIGPKVNIHGVTTLGDDNVVFGQASLGTAPQDLSYRGEATCLVIGDRNVVREFVTINRGTVKGGGFTTIGSDNLFMACCHVAHDCEIADHVIMANNVLLAGHVKVGRRANISGHTGAHHFVTIGAYAYVGGMTRMVQDVPPFMIVEGHPSRVRGVNVVGLERGGKSPEAIATLRDAYKQIYRNRDATETRRQILDRLEASNIDSEEVRELVAALRDTENGVKGRHREALREEFTRIGRQRILGEPRE